MAKPTPVFCEACKDTGWVKWYPPEMGGIWAMKRCPHCDTGATKEKK